ncbi:ASCH domain-containing protein [Haloplanus natans]|uniref:ASCH domain-containing protein n=1 Tax=Haloplanus natans TaxID=376171 RepID=UPI000A0499B9|nr:ASCH domain-containing protein [Haloplanus natans]
MSESSRVVFLSIHPQWAEKILDGEKEYEYRRSAPTLDPPYDILLYATDGASEVVGEARVDRILSDTVENLLDRTLEKTPHSYSEIEEYFSGNDVGQALHISDTKRYDEPIHKKDIQKALGEFRAPQNFLYLSPDENPEFFNLVPTHKTHTTQGKLNQYDTS